MKIEGPRPVAPAAAARRVGGPGQAGFTPALDVPSRTAASAPVSAAPPIDAILALQGDERSQRKARQTRRGKDALDALEVLERALLTGTAPAMLRAELERLQKGAETTGEAGLDGVLNEIDIRLAVELAKLDMAQTRG